MNARPLPQYELGDEIPYNNGRLSLCVIANDRFIIWPGQGRTVNVYRLATSPERAPLVKGVFQTWLMNVPGFGDHFFHATNPKTEAELSRMKKIESGYVLKESEDGEARPKQVGEITVYSQTPCRLIIEHKDKAGIRSFYEAPCAQPVIS